MKLVFLLSLAISSFITKSIQLHILFEGNKNNVKVDIQLMDFLAKASDCLEHDCSGTDTYEKVQVPLSLQILKVEKLEDDCPGMQKLSMFIHVRYEKSNKKRPNTEFVDVSRLFKYVKANIVDKNTKWSDLFMKMEGKKEEDMQKAIFFLICGSFDKTPIGESHLVNFSTLPMSEFDRQAMARMKHELKAMYDGQIFPGFINQSKRYPQSFLSSLPKFIIMDVSTLYRQYFAYYADHGLFALSTGARKLSQTKYLRPYVSANYKEEFLEKRQKYQNMIDRANAEKQAQITRHKLWDGSRQTKSSHSSSVPSHTRSRKSSSSNSKSSKSDEEREAQNRISYTKQLENDVNFLPIQKDLDHLNSGRNSPTLHRQKWEKEKAQAIYWPSFFGDDFDNEHDDEKNDKLSLIARVKSKGQTQKTDPMFNADVFNFRPESLNWQNTSQKEYASEKAPSESSHGSSRRRPDSLERKPILNTKDLDEEPFDTEKRHTGASDGFSSTSDDSIHSNENGESQSFKYELPVPERYYKLFHYPEFPPLSSQYTADNIPNPQGPPSRNLITFNRGFKKLSSGNHINFDSKAKLTSFEEFPEPASPDSLTSSEKAFTLEKLSSNDVGLDNNENIKGQPISAKTSPEQHKRQTCTRSPQDSPNFRSSASKLSQANKEYSNSLKLSGSKVKNMVNFWEATNRKNPIINHEKRRKNLTSRRFKPASHSTNLDLVEAKDKTENESALRKQQTSTQNAGYRSSSKASDHSSKLSSAVENDGSMIPKSSRLVISVMRFKDKGLKSFKARTVR